MSEQNIIKDRKLAQIEREIAELKSEANRAPLRIEMPLPAEAGIDIHFAYPAEDAPDDSTIIRCFLDENIEPEEWVIETVYTIDSYVWGTDDKAYHCYNPHTSDDEPPNDDCPITGENWEDFWELAGVDVHCILYSATALSECVPELKIGGPAIEIATIEDEWWCISNVFEGFVECE